MNIRASAAIRNNYGEISELCKKTQEPVYLTKNGEGDLVVLILRHSIGEKRCWIFGRSCGCGRRTLKWEQRIYDQRGNINDA